MKAIPFGLQHILAMFVANLTPITIIAALSLSVGIGFTAASEIGLWDIFPEMIKSVFASNVVAVVFVVSILLNLILPKDMDIKKEE